MVDLRSRAFHHRVLNYVFFLWLFFICGLTIVLGLSVVIVYILSRLLVAESQEVGEVVLLKEELGGCLESNQVEVRWWNYGWDSCQSRRSLVKRILVGLAAGMKVLKDIMC